MGDGNRMEKVDMAKDFKKLSESDKYFIRKIEKLNVQRAIAIKKVRRNSLITASLLGLGVVSIYCYTIYAVKQERFLEDFDKVPEKPSS